MFDRYDKNKSLNATTYITILINLLFNFFHLFFKVLWEQTCV